MTEQSGPDPQPVEPVDGPLDAVVAVPGSKSITNRALLAAALAEGRSRLDGVLFADDTEAMVAALTSLGVELDVDRGAARVDVTGCAGRFPAAGATVDARLSGTTSRFLLPALAAAGRGTFVLDGGEPLRARPFDDQFAALRRLGADLTERGEVGRLPVEIRADGLDGGTVALPADVSSQFASGLMLAGPLTAEGLRVELTTSPVSRPYLRLTAAVMREFGASVAASGDRVWRVGPGGYRATDVRIEPDASTASYFFAAAAICGGSVTVPGLTADAAQGDVGFVDVLERMGASVRRGGDGITVTADGPLRGVDVDMTDISDTAQTLAAVAVFAEGPTRVTGIDFIRAKETDRIAAVVAELRRCGLEATEDDDGFTVHPGVPRPAVVQTYDDHRMAMSFALLGLRVPGIEIADPGCVAKTFPDFFAALARLRPGAAGSARVEP